MKHLPFFLFLALSLNAQTPDKVSIYQPDDVKLNTKRKPPLTVGECIGFLQANAPQVFQFRSMMGADTIRTTVEIQDTIHRLVEFFQADTTPPAAGQVQVLTASQDKIDWIAWPTDKPKASKPVQYRYKPVPDTIYKTVYRDFLMHRDTVLLPCQDSPKATTFDGKLWLLACILTALAGGVFA